MIKPVLRILLLLSAPLFSACEKDDSIFTRVSIRFVMPDSRPVEKLEIIQDGEVGETPYRSYFTDINFSHPELKGKETIPFPDVDADNCAEIRLRKSVYTFIVYAKATYASGEVRILANTDYQENPKAVTWVQDSESIVLLLKSN